MKMAIRKMTKKDATTRLKSLQEFTDICERGSADEGEIDDATRTAAVKAVLPFW
jgi:hypothetical protein